MSTQHASLYVRLSDRADDANTSLQGMIDDMRALCAREGLTVLEPIRIDDGRSGGRRDRKDFQAWLNDARSGRAQVLVNPATDRLTREGLNVAATILDVLEGKDSATGKVVRPPVRLIDTKGLDSEHGEEAFRMQFVIQAEVGRGELKRISQRAKDTKRRLAAAGRWAFGAPPFGYALKQIPLPPDERGKPRTGYVLVVNSDEAKIVKECVRRILAGHPIYKVCHWLNEQPDVKPRRAKSGEFTSKSLKYILRAAPSPYLAEGETPILSPAETAAMRQILADRKGESQSPPGRRPVRLLSTLLTSSGCGAVLQVAHRSSKPLYRCQAKSQGRLCPHPETATCEPVEEYVTDRVLSLIGKNRMTRTDTIVSGADDLAEVELQISETVGKLAQSATAELLVTLQDLQRQREELSNKEPEVTTVTVDMGMTGAEWWEKATMDDRRDLIADMFPVMILAPGQRGRHGFDPARLPLTPQGIDHEYDAWLQNQ